MTLPISFCFLFGTPIAAWLACRYLRKAKDPADISSWGSSLGAGVLGATAVHFSAALFYTVGFVVLADGTHGATAADFFTVLFASGALNLGLWVFITLPVSMLCATVFWYVTKFSDENGALKDAV